MKLVYVKWEDSMCPTSKWALLEDFDFAEEAPPIVESVGWLLHDGAKLGVGGDSDGNQESEEAETGPDERCSVVTGREDIGGEEADSKRNHDARRECSSSG